MTAFLPEISGHVPVREQLESMLTTDRVPNGLLLHGDRGRGKRTLALAFARELLETTALEHPDLFVVARTEEHRLIGIDQVRRLNQEFSLTPAQADRRVAVIVDADRLTEEAGNALLKVLEEPPPSSHLILTARDREAVMETLFSRCRTLRVPPLSRREVLGFLEQRGIDANRARLLALIVEGRPGFALSLAEGEFEERVLAPAFRLLLPEGAPHRAAEEVVALAKDGVSKHEGARQRVRLVLSSVSWLLRASLKAACGSKEGRDVLDVLEPPLRDVLDGRDPRLVERQQETVLIAMRDVDRNVDLELILQTLIPALLQEAALPPVPPGW